VLFIILSLLLFLGIAFFQTLQGTYSALIMVVLTTLSAALAGNYYGALSQGFFLEYIPDYADAVSLAAIFFITLMVLRTLSDYFIRANIVIYPWPDRICAGLLSIPTALLIVGMGSISLEYLPYNDQVMLFDRFKTKDSKTVQGSIFPYADEYAGWVLSKLSSGCLQSGEGDEKRFGMVHPEWASEVSASRIAFQRESGHAVAGDVVKVTKVWKQTTPLVVKDFQFSRDYSGKGEVKVIPGEKRYAADNTLYLAMTIELASNAADGDGYQRFGWGQIRLVGFKGDPKNERVVDVYAIGFRDPSKSAEFDYMRIKVPIPPSGEDDEAVPTMRNHGPASKNTRFDVVFEVPDDFTPWFLEYKRWGRTAVPKVQEGATTPEATGQAGQATAGVVGGTARAGWHSEFQVDPQRTRFTSELPFVLKAEAARSAGEAEIANNEFGSGRIAGSLGGGAGALDTAVGTTVANFAVPSDKRLLRVECNFSPAQNSMLQQIFGAVQGVVQKKAIAKDGTAYLPVGQYVIANGSNGQEAELIYEPESLGQAMSFQKVQMNDLKDKGGKVGLLYLVPPGTELSRFEMGGTPIEVQNLQLVAPQ
jgi:uncharacterized membrane protein required for colicin V production